MPNRWGEPNEDAVRDALKKVIEYAKGGTADYARRYAVAALECNMTDQELRVQVLYILGNLVYWRGPLAREVKSTLRNEYAQSSNPIS